MHALLQVIERAGAHRRGAQLKFQKEVPGASNVRHATIRGAGHFVQEEKPEELAHIINQFIKGELQLNNSVDAWSRCKYVAVAAGVTMVGVCASMFTHSRL